MVGFVSDERQPKIEFVKSKMESLSRARWKGQLVVCTGTLHLFLRTQRPVTRESFKFAVTLMSRTNSYKQTMSLQVRMPTDIVI